MPQMTSGKVLREARERKDYDLDTVARRLRIRPDILRAIEAGDFSSMPPRGYTRNMVNAYARLLGLNPTEIVNMYLDEAYAHQVEKARGAGPASGFVMESDYQRRPRLRGRSVRDAQGADQAHASAGARGGYGERLSEETQSIPPARASEQVRHLYDDRTRYSRDDYGVTRDRVERPGRSERDFLSHHSGYSSASDFSSAPEGVSRGRGRAIQVGQTPMQYSAPRFPAVFRSRAVLIALAVVAVIAIVAVVSFVLGNNNQPAADDVSQLPVSGISDTTGSDEEQEEEQAQVEVAPTNAKVVYSVETGDECYVEIYADGQQSASMLSGPVQETVEVTGTWTITTWSPDTIKVEVNGEQVELASNAEYGGMYAYTVDFPALLEEWNSAHGTRSSQRQAAVASAKSAAAQDASGDGESSSSSSGAQSESAASSQAA